MLLYVYFFVSACCKKPGYILYFRDYIWKYCTVCPACAFALLPRWEARLDGTFALPPTRRFIWISIGGHKDMAPCEKTSCFIVLSLILIYVFFQLAYVDLYMQERWFYLSWFLTTQQYQHKLHSRNNQNDFYFIHPDNYNCFHVNVIKMPDYYVIIKLNLLVEPPVFHVVWPEASVYVLPSMQVQQWNVSSWMASTIGGHSS